MNYINNYNLLFFSSMVGVGLLTWLLIKYLPFLGLVDVPNNRHSHNKVTPTGGGVAIVIVVAFALIIFEYLTTDNLTNSYKFIFLLTIISSISFLDDFKPISAFTRLIVHLLCAGFAVFLFLPELPVFNNIIPVTLSYIITIIAFSGFINIYNFMDGIDGITCAETIHLSITILILCYLQFEAITHPYFVITLATITFGCSIGFLIFNWHPAKIFLGDVGSISFGFLIGFCLLLLASSKHSLLIACFIATLYYLADGGLTIFIRFIKKEKVWQPHLEHFFQKAVQKGKTHSLVVMHVIMCNIFLMILSTTSLHYPILSTIFALAVTVLTIRNLLK